MVSPRRHVILAEDDLELRKLIARALEVEGFEVTQAADAGQAIDRIAAGWLDASAGAPPSIVVTDVLMPGISGLDLLESLAKARCACPVVVITAFGSDATHHRALELGAAAVFDKPFDVDDLVATVRELSRRADRPATSLGNLSYSPTLRRPTGT